MSTAVITGATNGFGLVFAKKLLASGKYAHVILAARNEARCQETLAKLPTNVGSTKLEALPCDMNSLVSVVAFCNSVKARTSRIDLLVFNAGLFAGSMNDKTALVSADGLEATWAVNHLAHFVMFNELHVLLKAADKPRVTITSSALHASAAVPKPSRASLSGREQWWRDVAMVLGRGTYGAAYSDSKLANVAHALELHRRFGGEGIIVNALHPGVIRETGIWSAQKGFAAFLLDWVAVPLGRLFGIWQTVDQGADTLMAVAQATEGGQYRDFNKWTAPSALATDPLLGQALWTVSEALAADKLTKAK